VLSVTKQDYQSKPTLRTVLHLKQTRLDSKTSHQLFDNAKTQQLLQAFVLKTTFLPKNQAHLLRHTHTLPLSNRIRPVDNMATTSIKIRFFAQTRGLPTPLEWTHNYALPTALLEPAARTTGAYQEQLENTIEALALIYQAECTDKTESSGSVCLACAADCIMTVLKPFSLLHQIADPQVYFYVLPTCGLSVCKDAALRKNEEFLRECAAESNPACDGDNEDWRLRMD
jgi:hypothetical protein